MGLLKHCYPTTTQNTLTQNEYAYGKSCQSTMSICFHVLLLELMDGFQLNKVF